MKQTYCPDNAECLVFTFKEGLLSSLAHDLKLKVTRFEISRKETGEIHAWFDGSSLEVVSARRGETDATELLSSGDKRKIEATIREELFRKNPRIEFASELVREKKSGIIEVRGNLTLNDVTRSIDLKAIPRPKTDGAGRLCAEVVLQQPDFGMKPYSAALGTLRIRPEVRVSICLLAALKR